ncbi:multisubunit sodium/proton antiporter, MrpD subunit [Thiocapsa roseopersicina]|uniref:Multisubunit sodium/proton antiporter, MrpD subunit n=2 Tax=Thiocapsa roseopersicina TaxID=1058 RepID=A0A1H3ATR8_THIRO|nr:proton-conducting transporter membrane subunit [Thiocapsa roseopersicina]SDX33005.1 multisubunit sodium/proton antiporter, MrpD subunit [Thiocapsa roseopersicina]
MMIDALPLAVTLPLIGAFAVTVSPLHARGLGLMAAVLTAASALSVTAAVWSDGVLRADLGGWGVPLGIALEADGLSAAFLAMANVVALAVSVYAGGYFKQESARHFWPLWLLLWSALNGLFLAADLFNLYVTLELLGISAAALGALTGTREAVAANLRYLLVGLLGSMSYLLGVALIYAAYGVLDIGLVAEAIEPGPVAWTAMTLMIGGLILKAALFPMHFWLPPAHANAPAPVSAALSALVVKAAFYLALRLWLDVFAPVLNEAAANLLGILGAAAVVWGSWRALRAERLKLLAAYSTVAQMGYLFIAFPLLAATPPGLARDNLLAAVVLLALTHGFAKAGFFLAAGMVQKTAGHDRIDDLGGAAQALPAATFAIGLAGVALIGLPPSGTFLAKWVMLEQAMILGLWWWLIVMMVGTLLAAAYIFRVLSRAFNREPTPYRFVNDARTELPALLLGLIATFGLGIAAQPLWVLLEQGAFG